jgi:hypothetical protein
VGFGPTIPAYERVKTVHALDRAATVIGWNLLQTCIKQIISFMCKANRMPFEHRSWCSHYACWRCERPSCYMRQQIWISELYWLCTMSGFRDTRQCSLQAVTCNSCPLHWLIVLHIALIRSKLEYGSVVWNNLTLTDSNMLENVQGKSAIYCSLYRFYQSDIPCNCDLILNSLSSSTFRSR